MDAIRASSISTTDSNYSEEDRDKFDADVPVSIWTPRKVSNHFDIPRIIHTIDEEDPPYPSSSNPTCPSSPLLDDCPEHDLDSESVFTSATDDINNIYLHIHDEESRNYSKITTYHGMVRIFNSHTWISLIFWSLVVITCLTLFMIYSANILYKFHKAPTLMETSFFELDKGQLPNVVVCPFMQLSANTTSLNLRLETRSDYSVFRDGRRTCYRFKNAWSVFRDYAHVDITFRDHHVVSGYAVILENPRNRDFEVDYSSAVTLKPGHRLTGVINAVSTSWNAQRNEKTCFDYWKDHGLHDEPASRADYSLNACQKMRRRQVESSLNGSTEDGMVCAVDMNHISLEYEEPPVANKITISTENEPERKAKPFENVEYHVAQDTSPTDHSEKPLRPRPYYGRLSSVEEEREAEQGVEQFIGKCWLIPPIIPSLSRSFKLSAKGAEYTFFRTFFR
uniref:Amiloride-sensitive sodium channel n=1 Tax=Steinernema glaseri TaxID=37863 RepID=A0A1I7ZV83_9BILA